MVKNTTDQTATELTILINLYYVPVSHPSIGNRHASNTEVATKSALRINATATIKGGITYDTYNYKNAQRQDYIHK